ncbi:hypothetical protein GDO81_019335 [Engystomops pustulosus]|uniref:Uncharacterized protein n=1 Tax=Engystomops pustulosus TaxID=76066 RepID=A0AAV6ZAR2_ENGPU|nr:hypothetical protein GDO81_019335 [Engystomops pustulosus]
MGTSPPSAAPTPALQEPTNPPLQGGGARLLLSVISQDRGGAGYCSLLSVVSHTPHPAPGSGWCLCPAAPHLSVHPGLTVPGPVLTPAVPPGIDVMGAGGQGAVGGGHALARC